MSTRGFEPDEDEEDEDEEQPYTRDDWLADQADKAYDRIKDGEG